MLWAELPISTHTVVSVRVESHFFWFGLYILSNDGIEDAIKANGVRWLFADRADPSRIRRTGDHQHIVAQIKTLKVLTVKTTSSNLNSVC